MAHFRLACGLLIVAFAVLGNAYAIRGIQVGVDTKTGRRPFRQEFSTFKNSGPAFDLYILALQKIQSQDQNNPLSYFGIAGEPSKSAFVPFDSADLSSRHPWRSFPGLGRSQWRQLCRVLPARKHTVPYMASTLPGTLRG